MKHPLKTWTFQWVEEDRSFITYVGITREAFYRVLLHDISHAKFARINPDLFKHICESNALEQLKHRKHPKKFTPQLAAYKSALKYQWRSNTEVLERDKKKPLEEIGVIGGKQRPFSHAVIVVSRKDVQDILAFWYLSSDGYPRVYARFSSLQEDIKWTQRVINMVRDKLWIW
jgi:hypothetical protein